jgi:hypothetical protein
MTISWSLFDKRVPHWQTIMGCRHHQGRGICPRLGGACFVGQRTPQSMTQIRVSEDRTVDVPLCSILRWNWQVAYLLIKTPFCFKGHFRGLLMIFFCFLHFCPEKCKVAGYCNQGFVFFFYDSNIKILKKKIQQN